MSKKPNKYEWQCGICGTWNYFESSKSQNSKPEDACKGCGLDSVMKPFVGKPVYMQRGTRQ